MMLEMSSTQPKELMQMDDVSSSVRLECFYGVWKTVIFSLFSIPEQLILIGFCKSYGKFNKSPEKFGCEIGTKAKHPTKQKD